MVLESQFNFLCTQKDFWSAKPKEYCSKCPETPRSRSISAHSHREDLALVKYVNNIFSNQFGISGLPKDLIAPDKLYGTNFMCFCLFFLQFQTSLYFNIQPALWAKKLLPISFHFLVSHNFKRSLSFVYIQPPH